MADQTGTGGVDGSSSRINYGADGHLKYVREGYMIK